MSRPNVHPCPDCVRFATSHLLFGRADDALEVLTKAVTIHVHFDADAEAWAAHLDRLERKRLTT